MLPKSKDLISFQPHKNHMRCYYFYFYILNKKNETQRVDYFLRSHTHVIEGALESQSFQPHCPRKKTHAFRRSAWNQIPVNRRLPVVGSPVTHWGRIHLQGRRSGFNPRVGKVPRRRKRPTPPVFLPGKSQGEGSLAGYSPWGLKSQTWLRD